MICFVMCDMSLSKTCKSFRKFTWYWRKTFWAIHYFCFRFVWNVRKVWFQFDIWFELYSKAKQWEFQKSNNLTDCHGNQKEMTISLFWVYCIRIVWEKYHVHILYKILHIKVPRSINTSLQIKVLMDWQYWVVI